MDQTTYLRRFSRAVRWRLSPREAGEVLSDYEDLPAHRPAEDDSALVQDLGDPYQAARLLSEPKAYRRWMIVFCILAVCLLLPEILLLRAWFDRYTRRLVIGLLLVGIVVSLVWFRHSQGEARKVFSKGLPSALAALLMGLLAAGGVVWSLAVGAWDFLPSGLYGRVAQGVLWLAGSAGTAAGLWGVVKARTADRRWRALYVLGLAVLAECALVMALLTGLDLEGGPDWWVRYAVQWAVVGALSLVGTGASPC